MSKATPSSTLSISICVCEKKKQRERERASTTSMSGTADLHQLVCRSTVAPVYSSSVKKLPTSSSTWGHSYWNQQGCGKCKNQLLSIKSTGNSVDVPSSHSKSFLNYLHPPIAPDTQTHFCMHKSNINIVAFLQMNYNDFPYSTSNENLAHSSHLLIRHLYILYFYCVWKLQES